MQGRVKKTVRHPVMKMYVDFNEVGYERRNEWIEITDDILDISGSKEKSGKQIGSVSSDIATVIVDNSDNKFSKDNKKSPYYGKIKSNLRFRLLTGFKNEELVPYASGFIEKISPHRKEAQIRLSLTDYFSLFKDTDVPEDSYQDISWEGLINILCDHVKLPSFIVRHIPKTEFYYSYFKFEEDNCFEALKGLIEISVGEAFFEREEFYVKTKLALDYRLDDTADHEITIDDLFDFEEDVDGDNIINSVELTSNYKTIAPLQVVFETPENIIKIENEAIIYKGGNSITINMDNLPLINNEDNPIALKNITQGRTIYINGVDVMTGKITIHPNSLSHVAPNDLLAASYSYQQLALLAGKQRKYTFALSEEVDNLNNLDIAVWDENGEKQLVYSEESDKPNTVSKQMLSFDRKSNTVTLILKNNYLNPITISTLQLRGYPIKVISPIEVYVRDNPSIESFGKKVVSMQNNYINNLALAEKIAQYIVDNNKKDRKRANIEIEGYPEFSLDDISHVIEEKSGTSHKFTNERIDYSFSESGGWTVRATVIEIDAVPWVYESFKGESWEKTHSGEPDPDFLKDISANLIKNGGAELYTGISDYKDVGAVDGKHIVPDYWRFVRTSGNASSRIRDGGNLVLHGLHSFEITTSNGGSGYYEQVIDYIRPNTMHILSFVCHLNSCSGKAYVEQYEDGTLLESTFLEFTGEGVKELAVNSLARANKAVIRIEKLSGGGTSESLVVDKLKFENSKERTIYLENEETSPIQAGQKYANSLVIGNNYGIQVFDDLNNVRVTLGQYAPNKYGLQVNSGALEIIGGLQEGQIDPSLTGKWDSKIDQWFNFNYELDKNIVPKDVPVGGLFSGAFIPNQTTTGGRYNKGEINILEGIFIHPVDGIKYTIPNDYEIQTQFESSYVDGKMPNNTGFIMFVGSDKTRFPDHWNNNADDGVASFDFILTYKAGSQWFYDGNNGYHTFTPTQRDSIVAKVIGSNAGIIAILPYTQSRNGTYIDEKGIYAGVVRFDQLFGGEAMLGGADNVNGRLVVLNAAGDVIADLNAATGGFDKLYIGDIVSPSIQNVNSTSYSVDVTENVQQVIDEIPKLNNATVSIKFMNNISEDIHIRNFTGDGSIVIDLNGKKLNGWIDTQANSGQYVGIKNGTINTDYNFGIEVDRCTYHRFDDLIIYGKKGTTTRGIYVHAGASAYINNCKVYNSDSAIASATSGQVTSIDSAGSGLEWGLHAFDGGIIVAYGRIPKANGADIRQITGVVLGNWTPNTQDPPPAPPTPPDPPEKKTSWTSTTGANWSNKYNSWTRNEVKQGNYGYGRRTGIWIFPNTITSTLSGKTILSARAYVKRLSSGGSSSKTSIRVKFHSYTSVPSGQPDLNLSDEEKAVSLGWGEGAWITLPTSMHDNLKNGTFKGLGVYIASDSKSNYAIMNLTAKLEVTYK